MLQVAANRSIILMIYRYYCSGYNAALASHFQYHLCKGALAGMLFLILSMTISEIPPQGKGGGGALKNIFESFRDSLATAIKEYEVFLTLP